MDGSDHQSSVISGRKEVLGMLAAAWQAVRRTGLSVPMQRLLALEKRSGRAMAVLARPDVAEVNTLALARENGDSDRGDAGRPASNGMLSYSKNP